MALLTDAERQELVASYPDWTIDGERLTRTFQFADFPEALGFVTRVGLAAERAFHHPDIDIRYSKVTISLTTHSEGGLTSKDAELAARIDGFVG